MGIETFADKVNLAVAIYGSRHVSAAIWQDCAGDIGQARLLERVEQQVNAHLLLTTA